MQHEYKFTKFILYQLSLNRSVKMPIFQFNSYLPYFIGPLRSIVKYVILVKFISYSVHCTVYVLWFLKTENITFFILDANKIIWQARNKFRAGREKNFSAGNEETFLPNTLEYTQELARKMFRKNFLPGNFAKANVSMFVTCWQRKIKILVNIFAKIIFICFAPIQEDPPLTLFPTGRGKQSGVIQCTD